MVLKVKLQRIIGGYHQYEFAAMCELNPETWRLIETGRRKPSRSVALKAAEILGKPVDELFSEAGDAGTVLKPQK